MSHSELYIGIMTGTSLDGLDAVLVDFSESNPRLVAASTLDYPADLKQTMLALQAGSAHAMPHELHHSRLAAIALSRLYANAVADLLAQARLPAQAVAAIGAHGQTVRHHPQGRDAYTVQLLDAARLVEQTQVAVVCDFRARDIAAGGQGAPLVPAYHAALTHGLAKPLAVCNIGGFANVSLLGDQGQIAGFDTGPGNVLMDGWAQQHLGRAYDAEGVWAASAAPHSALLECLLAHPYFAQPLPKSTGREMFNLGWLQTILASRTEFLALPAATVQASLCAFTAHTITQAVEQHLPLAKGLYVCGGGAFNLHLMQQLEALLSCPVMRTEVLGVPAQQVEAVAFAWLARQCTLGLPGNVPSVTGAAGLRVLGAIYPTL